MNSTYSFLKTLLSVSPQNSVNGRHETSALYPVKCAECVSFDTVIVLKEKKYLWKACLLLWFPLLLPHHHEKKFWIPLLSSWSSSGVSEMPKFSHLFLIVPRQTKCVKKKGKKNLVILCILLWGFTCSMFRKKDVLLHLLLLLMQWKKEKENTTTYTATVWLHILQKRYYYNYYATKKTSPSPTKNTTMKMKKNVLLLLYIPQSINQGHIPSITSLYTITLAVAGSGKERAIARDSGLCKQYPSSSLFLQPSHLPRWPLLYYSVGHSWALVQHTMFTNHLEKSHLVDSREIVLARNMFLDSFSGGSTPL